MNKTQININKNHKNIIMDLEGLYGVMNMFELKNIGPLVQKFKFPHFAFHTLSQNCPTCTNHNLLNF